MPIDVDGYTFSMQVHPHNSYVNLEYDMIPTPPGKSLFIFLKFPGPGKSLKVSLLLESPGIYRGSTNMPLMYRTPSVNKCMKYSCNVLTEQLHLQLVMNVLRWIVLSHCIYRVS